MQRLNSFALTLVKLLVWNGLPESDADKTQRTTPNKQKLCKEKKPAQTA